MTGIANSLSFSPGKSVFNFFFNSTIFPLSEADNPPVIAIGRGKNALNNGEDDNRKAPSDNDTSLNVTNIAY